MTTERLIRIIAGSFILLSLGLAARYNDVRLFQSGFTRWCLLEDILKRLGVASGTPTCSASLGRPRA